MRLNLFLLPLLHALVSQAPDAAARIAESSAVERTPLIVAEGFGAYSVLSRTVTDQKLLRFESCALDGSRLGHATDLSEELNQPNVSCTPLNGVVFDVTTPQLYPRLDEVFTRYLDRSFNSLRTAKALGAAGSVVGGVLLGRWSLGKLRRLVPAPEAANFKIFAYAVGATVGWGGATTSTTMLPSVFRSPERDRKLVGTIASPYQAPTFLVSDETYFSVWQALNYATRTVRAELAKAPLAQSTPQM